MSGLVHWILDLSPLLIYVVVFALVFAEDALFVGFAIPGETAAVVAGVAANFGRLDLALAIVVVVAAAVIGDTVGYEVGKHFFGPKVLDSRFVRRHRERIESAQSLLRRRGGLAVFLGRFTAFFRAMMPALAGSAKMPYRRFLVWNAAGGIVWGIGFVTLGYFAGASYHVVENQVGNISALVIGVLVVAGLVAWRVHHHRAESP